MSATSVSAPIVTAHPLARTIVLYAKEAKYELVKNLRLPVYSVSTVALPTMFYVLFGIVLGNHSPINRGQTATYTLSSMGCFGVIAAALFGFGVSVAMERGQGWLQVKRASPMPLAAYFFAKLSSAMVFSLIIVLVLLAVGIGFGGVRLPVATAAALVGILVLGAIPFSAMGLAIGYFAKPNSAPAVVNLVYLPMAFCSGLWIPLFLLPHGFRIFAGFLPAFHLSQLALNVIGMGMNPTPGWEHVEALAGFTLLCLGVAVIGYRRDDGKTYG